MNNSLQFHQDSSVVSLLSERQLLENIILAARKAQIHSKVFNKKYVSINCSLPKTKIEFYKYLRQRQFFNLMIGKSIMILGRIIKLTGYPPFNKTL